MKRDCLCPVTIGDELMNAAIQPKGQLVLFHFPIKDNERTLWVPTKRYTFSQLKSVFVQLVHALFKGKLRDFSTRTLITSLCV